jgi:hypothetical protein
MDPGPPYPTGRTTTLLRLMRDVAIAGVALAGLAAPQNPLFSTLAVAAFCYFGFKLVFLAGVPLFRWVLRLWPSEPSPEEEDDGEIVWREEPWD